MRSFFSIYSFRFTRFIFRSFNYLIRPFGLVLSKPDFVHGSPAYSGVLAYSRRLFQNQFFLNQLKFVEGDIVEGGIHWGYGLLILLLLTDKKIHAFDSFSGHSIANSQDTNSQFWKPLDSAFSIAIEDVYTTINYGSPLTQHDIEKRLQIYPGWVDDTMPPWSKNMLGITQIAYVHADMDLYEPTCTILSETFPLLSKGAIVVLGNLSNPELHGKNTAFNEFLDRIEKKSINIKRITFVGTDGIANECTYFIKL